MVVVSFLAIDSIVNQMEGVTMCVCVTRVFVIQVTTVTRASVMNYSILNNNNLTLILYTNKTREWLGFGTDYRVFLLNPNQPSCVAASYVIP